MYKKDEKESELVRLAKSGSLAKLPESRTEKAVVLNHARRWTEVQGKWGYDKSWEWFDSTAITVAARRGELAMVQALLLAGADPTLEGCHTDDVYQNAMQAAEYSRKNTESAVKNLKEGKLDWSVERKVKTGEYGFNADQQASALARSHLQRLVTSTSLHNLLVQASKYWPVASYAKSHYSEARIKTLASVPNAPTDTSAMIKEIEAFDLRINVDEAEL